MITVYPLTISAANALWFVFIVAIVTYSFGKFMEIKRKIYWPLLTVAVAAFFLIMPVIAILLIKLSEYKFTVPGFTINLPWK